MVEGGEAELDHWRRAKDALRPVAHVHEVQVAGALSEPVAMQLCLPSLTRTVLIHPEVVEHILAQRQGCFEDAEFVFRHMADAIARPHYCGPDPRHRNRYDLVYLTDAGSRPLFIAIKLVPAMSAGTQRDELWISTGYPLGTDFRKRRRWKESLQPVLPVNP